MRFELPKQTEFQIAPPKYSKYIIVVGAGGTGTYLIGDLMRYLALEFAKANAVTGVALPPPVVLLIDGDTVEEKNLIRQHFIQADVGKPKAKVVADRYQAIFGLEILYMQEFLADDLADKIGRQVSSARQYDASRALYSQSDTFIFGCVDNNETRGRIFKLADALFRYSGSHPIWIDCGNSATSGQVIVSDISHWPCPLQYPGFSIGKDEMAPDRKSCADAAIENPQSILANRFAANAALSYFTSIISGQQLTSVSTYFDVKKNIVHPEFLTRNVIKRLNEYNAQLPGDILKQLKASLDKAEAERKEQAPTLGAI